MRRWIWIACLICGCGVAAPALRGAEPSTRTASEDLELIHATIKKSLAAIAARDATAISSTLNADGDRGKDIAKAQAERVLAGSDLSQAMQARFPGPDVSDALDAAGAPNPQYFYMFLYVRWKVDGTRATGTTEGIEEMVDGKVTLPTMIKVEDAWRIQITPDGPPKEPDAVVKRLQKETELIDSVKKRVDAHELTTADAVEAALVDAGLQVPSVAYRPAIIIIEKATVN